MINLISDDSDDEPLVTGSRKIPIGRGKSLNKGGLKPVRLHREEHKERVTLVNTEPTIKIQSDSEEEFPTIDELRSSRAPPKDKEFKGTYQDDEATRIKAEPDMEIELPYHGTPPPPESKGPAKDLTYSPEYKRKSKDQGESSAIDLDGKADGSVAKVKKDKKGRRLSKMKDKKPVIQTEEDRAEYERHLEDVAILANELGGLQGNLGAQSQDANGDVAMEDGDLEYRDKKEGRLYLFQFPPVLPELYNPTNAKPKTKAEIRAEKENEKAEKDVQMSGMSAKAKGKTKERIDLTRDATVVKVEEEVVLGPDGTPKKEEEKRKRDEVVHEEGWIGKLVVRESGKVELCWGGTNLVVGRGVDAGFLTTGVMVDMIEKGPPGGGAPEGKALSMGKVMGKFVVTPDWEKMV
jgi:DNA-directed RNA polymerase III subunit RPC4